VDRGTEEVLKPRPEERDMGRRDACGLEPRAEENEFLREMEEKVGEVDEVIEEVETEERTSFMPGTAKLVSLLKGGGVVLLSLPPAIGPASSASIDPTEDTESLLLREEEPRGKAGRTPMMEGLERVVEK